MKKKILRILLKRYTKIGYKGGIAKVIFDDEFEDIAEEIVKLFAIPVVTNQSELLFCGFCEIETEHIIYDDGNLQCKKCDWVAKP